MTKELQENAQLADRLFPFIVQKLDGNTLVQKLDVNTVSYLTDKMNGQKLAALILQKIHENQLRELVQKMDGQLQAEKVYPHLGLKAALTARPGQNSVMKASGPSPPTQFTDLKANCLPGELAIGGNYFVTNAEETAYYPTNSLIARNPNGWEFQFRADGDARISTGVNCLQVDLIGPEKLNQCHHNQRHHQEDRHSDNRHHNF